MRSWSRASKPVEGTHNSGSSAIRAPGRGCLRPGRGGTPRGLGRLEAGDGDQVLGGRGADLGDRRGGRPQDCRYGAADPADALREEPRHLIRADERLPLAQRLFAQERATTDFVPERVQRRLVGTVREAPERLDVDRFVLGVVGDLVDALAEPGQ